MAVGKVLPLQDLWVLHVWIRNCGGIWSVIQTGSKTQKSVFWFEMLTWVFFFCFSLVVLRRKVQIVLGSRLIEQTRPLEAYTIARPFGRLRGTNVPL